MTGDLKVGIRLTADGKGFVGEVRVAKRELDKLTGSTGKSSRAGRLTPPRVVSSALLTNAYLTRRR